MSRSIVALGGVSTIILALSGPLSATELQVPSRRADSGNGSSCGPCGCLQVEYVYHREMLATYGLDFDPRNYDATQPHFYLGQMRTYPRYFVDGQPIPGSC